MSHAFYVLNRSNLSNSDVELFKQGLKKEFNNWGYKVSDASANSVSAEIFILDETDTAAGVESESALVLADADVMDMGAPLVKASKIWNISYNVDAVFINRGNLDELTKGYKFNQFCPMTMIYEFGNLNSTEVVSYLVNVHS